MTDLNLEARTMGFMLSQRGNGRWFFKMQKGLEAMYYIRAWCGCVNVWLAGVRLNDTLIYLCPACYFDFTLYLSGCAVNPMVMVGDKKEAKE